MLKFKKKCPLIAALVSKCQTEETWELEYNNFHELKSFKNSQADGYKFKLNFFVYGEKEVHILLSATEKPVIVRDSAYEIGETHKIHHFFFFLLFTLEFLHEKLIIN